MNEIVFDSDKAYCMVCGRLGMDQTNDHRCFKCPDCGAEGYLMLFPTPHLYFDLPYFEDDYDNYDEEEEHASNM